MTRLIPLFLDFIKFERSDVGFECIGCVCYVPAHEHAPGSDIPCSSSWLMIL